VTERLVPVPGQTQASPKGDAAAERLLDAAERLFAERGVDGTSVRDIAASAGQRNTNAVGYYFGSKAKLVLAVVQRRWPAIDARRMELLAQGDGSARDVVAAMLVPLAELLAQPSGRYYAPFLRRLRAPDTRGHTDRLARDASSYLHAAALLGPLLGDLPPQVKELRVLALRHQLIDEVAFWSSRMDSTGGDAAFDLRLSVANLLDTAVAALVAPCSTETIDALASPPDRSG
jgi:AcrR family transcriptional regulator